MSTYSLNTVYGTATSIFIGTTDKGAAEDFGETGGTAAMLS